MAKTYRAYLPEQDFLLPPSLRDWLPADHLVYFVSDVVDALDLSEITSVYEKEDRGYPPYHPVMMTKVLVYAYCVGIFSSRRIQRRLAEDVGFRVLAAGNEPDFRTIADFRKTHLAALTGFFEQVLELARATGAPRLGLLALDGTKIKSQRVEAQGDELRPDGREATAAAGRGEGLARASGGGRCRGGRAVRGGSARRRAAR
jgi:transposase